MITTLTYIHSYIQLRMTCCGKKNQWYMSSSSSWPPSSKPPPPSPIIASSSPLQTQENRFSHSLLIPMYVCMYQPPSNRRFAASVSFLSHAMKACAAYQTHTYIHYILLMCRMYVCMYVCMYVWDIDNGCAPVVARIRGPRVYSPLPFRRV